MAVYTAPLAIVLVGGRAIGKMKTIQVDENLQRGRVQGLGQLVPDEVPPLSWAGQMTCAFYNIDFTISPIPNAIQRLIPGGSLQVWQDSLTLQSIGVQVDMYKKVPQQGSPGIGLIGGELKPYASIKDAFIEGDSFDVSEAQISGSNQRFVYLTPIMVAI